MILLHTLLFFSFLLPAISAPNLSRAIARISEARARAASHRDRVREHTARNANHVRSSRLKRQHDDFSEDYEPLHFHICPLDDENCALRTSAFNEEDTEGSLDQPLQKLIEGKTDLNKFEEQGSMPRQDGTTEEVGQSFIPSHSHGLQQFGHGLNSFHTQVPGFNHNPGLHQTTQTTVQQTTFSQPGLHLHHPGLHLPGLVPHHMSTFSQIPNVHGSTIFPHMNLRESENEESKNLVREEAPEDFAIPDVETKESVFDPFHQKDEVMDFLDKHQVRGMPYQHYEENAREANSILEKLEALKTLKLKKIQKLLPELLPTYDVIYAEPYPHYSYFNPAIEQESEEDYREANPTFHKLKKLKAKKLQKLQPQYPSYPAANPYHAHYQRESENPIIFQENEDFREADPTIHKLEKLKQKKLQQLQPQYSSYPSSPYGHYYKNADYGEEDESLRSPFLLDFPARLHESFSYNNKRSADNQLDEILRKQRKIIESLHQNSKNDEDLKLVVSIANRTLTDLENHRKNITKRSIPLTRLISDPSVRLDVPKTIENFGTVAKATFEDEKAPLYHFKHLIGSSKNALLSAMKIPPQNMIIPADYEIVKVEDKPYHRHRKEESSEYYHTFNRVGEMVRDSIKSSQDTATHIGQIAHDARNMLNSARHSAPRLIVPFAQIPAVQRGKISSKTLLITPRILDLAHEENGKKSERSNFVRLGHLMDAVGISKPNSKSLDLTKIIFSPRREADAKMKQLYNRFRQNFDNDDTVGEAISTLEDAKISVGAKNLRDLLIKMRGELTSRNGPEDHKKKYKSKRKKAQETKEMGIFIEKLFDGSTEAPQNDTVGASMYLPAGLLQPFMGGASDTQIHDFLHENDDDIVEEKSTNKAPSDHYQNHYSHKHENQNHTASLGYVLGAINPLMLERMYNQTVHIKDNNIQDPESLFTKGNDGEDGGTVGTMHLNGPMLKPFMGQIQPEAIEKFLDTYNHENQKSKEED